MKLLTVMQAMEGTEESSVDIIRPMYLNIPTFLTILF